MKDLLPRCSCGRFVSLRKPHGWYKYGEHGTEEGWICSLCVTTWVPRDGRGRGPEAGYCGVSRVSDEQPKAEDAERLSPQGASAIGEAETPKEIQS